MSNWNVCSGAQSQTVTIDVAQVAELAAIGVEGDCTEFQIELSPEIAGLQYYKLRMYPFNEAMSHPFELGCMIWV